MPYNMSPEEPEAPEKPVRMRWDGTVGRGREFENWARDAALLSYAQVSPSGNDDEPWTLRVKVELADGQGDTWAIVPKGATVHYGGTQEDPKFTFRMPRKAAEEFGG